MLALRLLLKFRYLPAKPRDILTSFHQLLEERTRFPLIRKLGEAYSALSFSLSELRWFILPSQSRRLPLSCSTSSRNSHVTRSG
uniref:Uncharacterized protein n=1 Tax=Hyaloperonospora arabidopsidis (strain Emoy2) TaxID=559515 RepID=M4BHW1_HYAAE